MADPDDLAAAEILLTKLRDFIASLDDKERRMFASLLAPGVAAAYVDEAELRGYSNVEWRPSDLPEALAEAMRNMHIVIDGL